MLGTNLNSTIPYLGLADMLARWPENAANCYTQWDSARPPSLRFDAAALKGGKNNPERAISEGLRPDQRASLPAVDSGRRKPD